MLNVHYVDVRLFYPVRFQALCAALESVVLIMSSQLLAMGSFQKPNISQIHPERVSELAHSVMAAFQSSDWLVRAKRETAKFN